MSSEPTPTTESTADATPTAAAPSTSRKKAPKTGGTFIWGTGRRKAAIARVRIRPGDGKFIVNKRELDTYFPLEKDRQAVTTPLRVTDSESTTDVFVNVGGGGVSGQAGAVLLGLARALAKANPTCEPKLREHNLLRRDPRRVERKKYGQRGARRRFQFSKR